MKPSALQERYEDALAEACDRFAAWVKRPSVRTRRMYAHANERHMRLWRQFSRASFQEEHHAKTVCDTDRR